jgi:hypothetical protein
MSKKPFANLHAHTSCVHELKGGDLLLQNFSCCKTEMIPSDVILSDSECLMHLQSSMCNFTCVDGSLWTGHFVNLTFQRNPSQTSTQDFEDAVSAYIPVGTTVLTITHGTSSRLTTSITRTFQPPIIRAHVKFNRIENRPPTSRINDVS